jgi:hypothetical protein
MTGLQMESEFKNGARFWFNLKHHGLMNTIGRSPSIREERDLEELNDNDESGAE